ncbi:MAG: nitroreductase family deazaflavin-dependent oxidoreductase [Proteobacteria bacterium]|nr:nitroreductase family deazaflavin-dependent oxidoreductase [Pseudomonadota bacterium]
MADASIPPDLPSNLPDWIREHVRRYLESDGADGHLWDSSFAGGPGVVPTLLLTTTGRKSGKPKLLPLIYGKTDGGYAIVASKGGAPEHPAWYLNLTAQPEVAVQVEAKRFRARARTLAGAERRAVWDQMVEIYAPYTEYQQRTEREIPVVVLEPIED